MDAQPNVMNKVVRSVPVDPVLDLEFDKAFALLRTLVDFAEAERLHPSRDNAVYTTSVILWKLVFQRLNPEVSLEAAVKHLIENPPDLLPDNIRVSEGTISTNTGDYRQARKRMPTEAARWVCGAGLPVINPGHAALVGDAAGVHDRWDNDYVGSGTGAAKVDSAGLESAWCRRVSGGLVRCGA